MPAIRRFTSRHENTQASAAAVEKENTMKSALKLSRTVDILISERSSLMNSKKVVTALALSMVMILGSSGEAAAKGPPREATATLLVTGFEEL